MISKVEITIPVLNEEETLEVQIDKVIRHIEGHFDEDIQLVIADNGSSDKTQEIGEMLQRENKEVKYLRLEERGVGRALKTSWGQSKAEIVGYMDLDLATDLNYLKPAIDSLMNDEADVVTGSRLAKGAKVIGRSLLRSITSRVFNGIVKVYFMTGFSDGMCGFKFLKQQCFKKLTENGAISDGWFFATEVLVVAEHLDFRVKDIPVTWTDDPNSKVKIMRLTKEYLKAMKLLKKSLQRPSEEH